MTKLIDKSDNILDVKKVDLNKEIEAYMLFNAEFLISASSQDIVRALAKHFFELGLKAQKEEKYVKCKSLLKH